MTAEKGGIQGGTWNNIYIYKTIERTVEIQGNCGSTNFV